MRGLLSAILLLTGINAVAAAELQLTVVDDQDRPLTDAVVEVWPLDEAAPLPTPSPTAVMDQIDMHFVPHVLPVAVGTAVSFPNSDQTRHSIYSFSATKRFKRRLYKGTSAEPVVFDQAGTAVLGCNIHDSMTGYVYVTQAPWFARSGEDGLARAADLPAGDYRVELWHPNRPAGAADGTREITVSGAGAELTVGLAVTSASIHKEQAAAKPAFGASTLQQRFSRFRD